MAQSVGFSVLVQHTLATPQNYLQYDAAEWPLVPYRPPPVSGELGGLDERPGWIMAINVQGNVFQADHYHVLAELDLEEIWCAQVTVWNDDREDWPADQLQAEVWVLQQLKADPQFGGRLNTRQSRIVYCVPGSVEWNMPPVQGRQVRDLADFVPPVTDVRHGIWVAPALYEAHRAARGVYSWQAWKADLPGGNWAAPPAR